MGNPSDREKTIVTAVTDKVKGMSARQQAKVLSLASQVPTSSMTVAEQKMLQAVITSQYDVSIGRKFQTAEEEVEAAIRPLPDVMKRTWNKFRPQLIEYCRENRKKYGLPDTTNG